VERSPGLRESTDHRAAAPPQGFFCKSLQHVKLAALPHAHFGPGTWSTVSAMAAPGKRMRFTIEVLPLAPENAHGPHRDQALAATFKDRRFGLPLHSEDTFEQVWAQIEQRFKQNYCDARQIA